MRRSAPNRRGRRPTGPPLLGGIGGAQLPFRGRQLARDFPTVEFGSQLLPPFELQPQLLASIQFGSQLLAPLEFEPQLLSPHGLQQQLLPPHDEPVRPLGPYVRALDDPDASLDPFGSGTHLQLR